MEAAEVATQQHFGLASPKATSCLGPQTNFSEKDSSNKRSNGTDTEQNSKQNKRSVSVSETNNNNNDAKIANLGSQQQQQQAITLDSGAQLEQQVDTQNYQLTNNNNINNKSEACQQQQSSSINSNNSNIGQNSTSSSSSQLLSNCVSSCNNGSSSSSNSNKEVGVCENQLVNARDFGLLAKETQELKIKTRKLQLEIDEKNYIINVLKDELESAKDQNDKFQRDNLQLLKDSKRVKFLQDENDFLQDKMGNVDKLELELKRLKEKLAETEFLKLRIGELEEDKTRAQEESSQFEDKWQKAEQKLSRVSDLETELNKWKLFSHELEQERNSIQGKLLESIEQEAKLNSTNKQVEDEVKRLRSLIRSYEEQRDEEQASNSLIMSVADLKQLDQQQQTSQQQLQDHCDILDTSTTVTDTSIKFEIDQQLEKELNEENRNLKQKLNEQEIELSRLIETNQEIRLELESNKKLISDLRQDLACEKSLASKLTKQLTTFTKQIKNLDKQYFPIHDTASQQQSLPPSQPSSEAIKASSFITHEQTIDRKSHISDGNDFVSSNKHEEKESSLSKSVTSFESQRQQQTKDTTIISSSPTSCKNDKKKPNELQGNNSDGVYNETRQQQDSFTNGSKLSVVPTKELAKNYSPPDNGIKSGKQSSILRDILKTENKLAENDKGESQASTTEQEARQCSTQTSAVMNKSTVALENPNKDKDESCCASGLLSASTNNNATRKPCLKQPAEANDKSGLASNTLSSSPLIDREDEPLAGRKYVHGTNNISSSKYDNHNNTNGTSSNRLTNVSPSSNACSQSSSPSTTVTVGHDSGFQSINHDFNHQLSSPPSTEVRRKISSSEAATLDGEIVGKQTVSDDDAASTLTNRSTPKKQQVRASSSSSSSSNRSPNPLDDEDTGAPSASGHHLETPTSSTRKSSRVNVEQSKVPIASVVSNQADTANSPYSGRNSNISLDRSHQEQQQQQPLLISAKVQAPTKLASTCSSIRLNDPINDQDEQKQQNHAEGRDDQRKGSAADGSSSSNQVVDGVKPVEKRSSSGKTRNFVRNSLPSRSVNFGHSKSSAYLDRIRASVTATTTTNTTSSFNEQTHRNIVLSRQQPGQSLSTAAAAATDSHNHNHHPSHSHLHLQHQPHFVLNCMLDHQHGERCFVNTSNHHANHVHGIGSPATTSQQPVTANIDGHHHALHRPILQSSRQLNALIDPVSNEQLMMSLHHQQQQQQHHLHAAAAVAPPYGPALEVGDLTEQQIARLTSLHHQHYYHHLQHMHQLHQLHHQHHMHVHHHRMHHRYQQQQQQQQASSGVSNEHCHESAPVVGPQQDSVSGQVSNKQQQRTNRVCEPIYSGGSQFYAPTSAAQFDQIYSSMTANNNINQANEQQHSSRSTSRLVNSSNTASTKGQSPVQESGLRSSPNGNNRQTSGARSMGPHTTQQQQQQQQQQINGYATLPQIDEVNGLPSVVESINNNGKHRNSPITRQHRSAQVVMTSDAIAKAHHHNNSSSSSPTSSSSSSSSGSSNLSPSSASSSSSLNSLSTSSAAPLNRSAALRHTTTDLLQRSSQTQRHFSIERELDGALPMTATLSRVGSCRVNRSTDNTSSSDILAAQSLLYSSSSSSNNKGSSLKQVTDASHQQILRTPVKSQQPSMRTSKILNISNSSSSSSGCNQQQPAHHNQQQLTANQLGNRRPTVDGGSGGVEKLVSNLASIRLNDSLAFTSLRAPKNCSLPNGSLNRLLVTTSGATNNNNNNKTTKSSNEKLRSNTADSGMNKPPSSDSRSSNGEAGNSGKSSVWFEYGCV